MTDKEIAELRRRYRADKSNITTIRGCYVNGNGEIVSEFTQSLGFMSDEEAEGTLSILKKVLSGTQGKNLIDIEFSTTQVTDSNEHKLLMKLKNSELGDNEAVAEFYRNIIPTIDIEGNFLIMFAFDKYDVFSYTTDGKKSDESTEVFSYFVCAVCPIKEAKPELSYFIDDNSIRNSHLDGVISSPELGFMFPAFNDRTSNIYNTLFYTRDVADNHPEFVETAFGSKIPMSAAEQKETFDTILEETISDECKLDIVQTVHRQLSELIEEHKSFKEEEPLVITKSSVKEILDTCGVSKEHIDSFEEQFDTQFGENTELNPQNIINLKQFEVSTSDVSIKVKPERSDLVETRMIDGVKYILIKVEDNVEVNGVSIHI